MEPAQASNEGKFSDQDLQRFLDRYKKLRSTGIQLNSMLVTRLQRETLEEGAWKLGLLDGNNIVFNSSSRTKSASPRSSHG